MGNRPVRIVNDTNRLILVEIIYYTFHKDSQDLICSTERRFVYVERYHYGFIPVRIGKKNIIRIIDTFTNNNMYEEEITSYDDIYVK